MTEFSIHTSQPLQIFLSGPKENTPHHMHFNLASKEVVRFGIFSILERNTAFIMLLSQNRFCFDNRSCYNSFSDVFTFSLVSFNKTEELMIIRKCTLV